MKEQQFDENQFVIKNTYDHVLCTLFHNILGGQSVTKDIEKNNNTQSHQAVLCQSFNINLVHDLI